MTELEKCARKYTEDDLESAFNAGEHATRLDYRGDFIRNYTFEDWLLKQQKKIPAENLISRELKEVK